MKKKLLTAATGLYVLAAAGSAVAAPLKIAINDSFSGPQASTGLLYRTAARYAVAQMNAAGGWNGQPIELLEYDNLGTAVGAADKTRAAIADGAQIFLQGGSSVVAAQITDDVRKYNLRNPGKEVMFVNIGAVASELTGEKCHFYHFRMTGNAQVYVRALVAAMKEQGALGTDVYAINQNYSWGQDMEKAIVDNAGPGGYTVVEKTLHDVNKIQDFSPYVAKIAASKASTVLTGNWSNDLLLMMKATKAAGLKARFGTVFLDQPGNIANGGDLTVGHFVAHPFNSEAGGAEGDKFAADYKAKTGHFPAFIEPQTVFGLALVHEALKSVKASNGVLSVKALALAMETTKVKTPVGELSIRAEDHQVLLPVVVSTVSKDAKYKADDTQLGFKPVKVVSAKDASAPVQPSCVMQRP